MLAKSIQTELEDGDDRGDMMRAHDDGAVRRDHQVARLIELRQGIGFGMVGSSCDRCSAGPVAPTLRHGPNP